jgi:hypothetical protein
MRWRISPHGHDPRQIDLVAIFALLILIGAAFEYLGRTQTPPTSTTAFIESSQTVRW